MATYEFTVKDSGGLWGSMRVDAATEQDAKRIIRDSLQREEVEPHGSLLTDFRLEPATTTSDKGE